MSNNTQNLSQSGRPLSMEEFIHSMSSTMTQKVPAEKTSKHDSSTRQEIIDRISKPVHSSIPIHYTNTATIVQEMRDCKQIADQAKTVDNFQANSKLAQQQQNALKQAQLFQVEQFYELSEGNDDRLASDSEPEEFNEQQADQKDTGSTQVFMKLIAELNYVGTMQSALAVQIINQSIDFSILKFRQLFISNGGVTGLFKIINNMMLKNVNETDRQIFIQQGLTRTDINAGYDVLLTLCTLLEVSKDSRRAILAEDAIRIALSLARAKFDPQIKNAPAFKARALRMLAGCALDAKARNYMRRIQIVSQLQKLFVQGVKDYELTSQPENASFICGSAMCLQNLMKSRRCLNQMIKTGGILQLINSLNKLYEHAKKSFAFPLVEDFCVICSQTKKVTEQLDSLLVLTIMNILRSVSTIKAGRAEIQAAKSGIERIVSVLDSSKGARDNRIKQRAVAILANCAQDPGVDKSVREAGGLTQLSQLLRDSSKDDYEMLLAICRTLVAICRSGPYFGSAQTCYPLDERDYLVYNQRNEDNIVSLVGASAIENLTQHINIPLDILQNSDLDSKTLIVGQVQQKDAITIHKQQNARLLVVFATNALVPLLSAASGRSRLRSNDVLLRALLNHLKVADVEVLISTLFALATACQNDQEIVKIILKYENDAKNKIEVQKFLFTLLNHKNLQVVTAAAMALNPICRNERTAMRQQNEKTRAFEIGRKITQTLQMVSQLLHRSYEFELNDSYSPRLVLEMKGWLMGIIAELAQDKENAVIFTDYKILEIVCNLLLDHAKDRHSKVKRAYDFHIDQLIKEKGSLALATLSKIEMNVATVAEMNEGQAIRALVKCLQTPDGVAVFDIADLRGPLIIGTKVDQCVHKFGAEVVFADNIADQALIKKEKANQIDGKQNKEEKTSKKAAVVTGIDKDPQATPNPYSVVNRSVCCAMAELSKNRKCALLLRQYGAVYGLLTLAGSSDEMTQKQAAEAIQNIREQHICALAVHTNRKLSEFPEDYDQGLYTNVNARRVDVRALTAAAERMYDNYVNMPTRQGLLTRSSDNLSRYLNTGGVGLPADDDIRMQFDDKPAATNLKASMAAISVMEQPDTTVKRAEEYQAPAMQQISQQLQKTMKIEEKKAEEARKLEETQKVAAAKEEIPADNALTASQELPAELKPDLPQQTKPEQPPATRTDDTKKEEKGDQFNVIEGEADYRPKEEDEATKNQVKNVIRKRKVF